MPKRRPHLPDTLPTWDEVALHKRMAERLAAENKLLRGEHRVAQGHADEADEAYRRIRGKYTKVLRRRDELENLLNNETEARTILANSVRKLEQENGELEARLARALGRVLVMAKEDEVSQYVGLLWQIRERCEATLKTTAHVNISGLGDPGSPAEQRLRQVIGDINAIFQRHGVQEKQATDIGKEAKG